MYSKLNLINQIVEIDVIKNECHQLLDSGEPWQAKPSYQEPTSGSRLLHHRVEGDHQSPFTIHYKY